MQLTTNLSRRHSAGIKGARPLRRMLTVARLAPKPRRGLSARLLRNCAAFCFATLAAYGSPIVYTFTGTAPARPGAPSHPQVFQLNLPDFLPAVFADPLVPFLSTDPALRSCVPCAQPPVPALVFLRGSASDLVQFLDENGTTYPYFFPANSLVEVGTHYTIAGINVNPGVLEVAQTPEASTAGFFIIGLTAVGVGLRRRGANPAAAGQQGGFCQ